MFHFETSGRDSGRHSLRLLFANVPSQQLNASRGLTETHFQEINTENERTRIEQNALPPPPCNAPDQVWIDLIPAQSLPQDQGTPPPQIMIPSDLTQQKPLSESFIPILQQRLCLFLKLKKSSAVCPRVFQELRKGWVSCRNFVGREKKQSPRQTFL